MGEFGINLGRAEQLAGKIESFETELRNYAERIEQVSDRKSVGRERVF